MYIDFKKMKNSLEKIEPIYAEGRVKRLVGLTIEAEGIIPFVGEICYIHNDYGEEIECEVVGINQERSILMPFGDVRGISTGSKVVATKKLLTVNISEELIGCVLNGLGRIQIGDELKNYDEFSIENKPPVAINRKPISEIIQTGVRAIDGTLTCGVGQRVGVFAGSGVGKSTLMGMLARNASADVNVIGLIGERGRELQEFIYHDLGQEGLKKSIIVCATSDEPALIRLKASLVTTAIAEYFRDKGKNVILMMDSVTRFAMAQREVGLAIGEPPATKGYTPSVFALLPKLLERTGPSDKGSITAFYTVLVDGDDMNDPIADTVRGILDGHIVLSRELAQKNHYPAIDVLKSVSRLMSKIVSDEHKELAGNVRNLLAVYKEAEDLINIGAYVHGSNPEIDRAIQYISQINEYLKQSTSENTSYEQNLTILKGIFNNLI